MSNTKQRGRPLNPEDFATLARMADCLLAEPELKHPTTVMRRLGIDDPTVHKRIVPKWKAGADTLMRDAEERRAAAQREDLKRTMHQLGEFLVMAVDVLRNLLAEGVARFQQWAIDNPEQADKLKGFLVQHRDNHLARIAAQRG